MRGRTLLIAGLLTAAYAGQASAQLITGSPHDLSGDSVGDNNEICVYCHTPHGADTTVEAPLWNKPVVATTYTPYDSTTIDGDILSVGSVSIACLTCHDGTQAMDAVINGPGPGAGTMPGTGAKIGDAPVNALADLGIDLSNDHPIGIQYGGFDVSGQIDPDFENLAGNLETALINGQNVWWVDTEAAPNGLRDKGDMILYTRDNSGDQPFVECATCHDPHKGDGTTTEVNFLRISNDSSDLCLACHIK
jgi:predicted CXXCH cytochrome family protein